MRGEAEGTLCCFRRQRPQDALDDVKRSAANLSKDALSLFPLPWITNRIQKLMTSPSDAGRQFGPDPLRSARHMVSGALSGEWIELKPLTADRLLLYYRRTCVREINLQKRQSYPVYFSREERVFEDD